MKPPDTEKNATLMRRGFLRILWIAPFFVLFGGWSVYTGWAGLQAGEILISPKNAMPYLATPGGASAFAFYARTIGMICTGALFFAVGLTLGLVPFFSSSPRGQRALEAAGQQNHRFSPVIPRMLAVAIAVGMLVFFVAVAIRKYG